MIIQINATVCTDMDHGEGWQRMIAASDRWGESAGGRKRVLTRTAKICERVLEMSVLVVMKRGTAVLQSAWCDHEALTTA
jgi:hypothetical protein